ncbi:MAG: putative DNA binding domain-containing protein [Bacteroidales bacterium]|nr:putative DNA binding domain-containing protein [Bacteroidales bacterium]
MSALMENMQLSLFDYLDNPLFFIINGEFPNNESEELEYKSAKSGFPTDFWKTYSAFANTEGGVIILGVKETKGDFLIEGLDTTTINKYKKYFWDNINNPHTISINLLSDKDVKVITTDDKDVLAFYIPSATRIQRPVHLTRQPFDTTFKRNHEGDYRCTKEEVRRMMADADTNTHPDSRILEGFTIEDIDLNSLKQYRQLFAAAKPTHPWLALENLELLRNLGGYRKDRVSKKEGFTLAGVLMFGKGTSITDPECAPNFFPDFREILSTDPNVRWTDRFHPDGTWESNLFQFYYKVWPRLSSSLPKPFQLKEGRRQDETPAHIALREAFVNALVHTDYSAPGNLIIEHKADTFQFSNPGTLLVSLRQYYQGGISECRNPSLQKMFMFIGSAEKAGSGVSKIMSGWEYAHWRTPYILIFSQPDRVVLELPMFSILPEETLENLRELFGDQIDALGKDELTILAACHIEGEISNSRLQYMIDMHRSDITKILQDLCKQGYLLSDNKGRWTAYHLNTEYLKSVELEDTSGVTTTNTNMDTSVYKINRDTSPDSNKDTSSDNGYTSSVNRDTSIEINMDTSGANMDTSIKKKDTSVKERMKKADLENSILDVCKAEYKTSEEIGALVKKTPKYLKNYILPSLVESGKLERLHPTTNHPQQAYKTKTAE